MPFAAKISRVDSGRFSGAQASLIPAGSVASRPPIARRSARSIAACSARSSVPGGQAAARKGLESSDVVQASSAPAVAASAARITSAGRKRRSGVGIEQA
jgi:hypothetical protein